MDETLPFLSSYGLHHPDNGHILLDVVNPGDDDETVFEFSFAPSTTHAMIYGVSVEPRGTTVSLLIVPVGADGYISLVFETGDREAAETFINFLAPFIGVPSSGLEA